MLRGRGGVPDLEREGDRRAGPAQRGVPLSADDVRHFLDGHGWPEVSGVVRIEHGHWSRAFRFDHGGRPQVVRFGADAADYHADRRVATMPARVFPVPDVLQIGPAFDGHCAISEYVPGGYLDDVDAGQLRLLLPDLLAMLDAVRAADLSATSGYGEWRADAHAGGHGRHPSWRASLLDVGADRPGSRTHGWRDRLASSAVGTSLFDEALRRFEGLVDAWMDGWPDIRCLVHGDLFNYNFVVSAGRIAGLLDWGWSKYGDFLYDIARLSFWAADRPSWRGVDVAAEALRHYRSAGVDVPCFAERLRCYQVHVGLCAQVHRAHHGQWAGLAAIALRTLALASARPSGGR